MFTNRGFKYFITLFLNLFLISGLSLHPAIIPFGHAASTITSDGTMGTTINQAGNIYNIDGGTIKGNNQFHSFGLFCVGTGDTASFNGPGGIANIIGRVTGGQQSLIDGILRSTIPGANLYLLNPYGVLFGKNASLDLSGSFHVSTADYLRFSDGARFYANLSNNSTLTSAPIAAFGFLTNTPAPILIQGSNLNVPEGQTLSVVGGDIQIDSEALLKAPHGQINIASVASAGEVIPNLPGQLPALDVSSFAILGQITESGSNMTVSSTAGAGTILIRGGRLVMDNAYMNANTTGNLDGDALGIDVQLTGDLVLTNMAQILTSSAGAGRAGDIRIKADRMEILGGSFVYSYSGGSRDSGYIEVTTNSLTVKDGAYIGTQAYSTGNSGDLTVNTGSLKAIDGSSMFTGTYGTYSSGNAGKLEIDADDILISGGPAGGAIVGSYTAGTGNCGDLQITAKNLQILNGSHLYSNVYSSSSGNGGTIEVAADSVFISGDLANPGIDTGIFTNTFGVGKGGSLSLTANSLEMTNRASLQAATFGTGDAGKITLRVGSLELKDASFIATNGIFGMGLGNSGNIEVSANRVFISGLENSTDPFGADATGFSTASREGKGGDIYIKTDSLTMTNRGKIDATSYGSGRAGNIRVDAKSVELLNGAFFLSSAYGSGNGGKIEVIAENVLLSGVHPVPASDITGNISPTPSGIGAQAFINGGNAGDVRITAGTLKILDGARITTQTFGAGNGGDIEVTANNVIISGVNAALKEFLIGKGIDAEEAGKLASAKLVTSTSSSGSGVTGNAGNLRITARNVQVQDGGLISSETETSGNGGNIEFIIDRMNLLNGATVSAESSGAGYAGNIGIKVTDILLLKDSSITTEAKYTDGGNIQVDAGYKVSLVDSKITASVGGGPETTGGNITIDPHYVILNDSQIIANAYKGKGGNIRINADVFLASPESVVDASSKLGINGTVYIRAPITNISGTLAPMQGTFLSEEVLLRDRCAAKIRGEKYSSFVVSGRDGLPIRPGSVLPSPIY